MSPDDTKVKAHHITPWRAAVLGSWIALAVYGIINERQDDKIEANQVRLQQQQHKLRGQTSKDRDILSEVRHNAARGRLAICVEVNFLENSLIMTKAAIRKDPGSELTPVRRDSARRLAALVHDIRGVVPGCPALEK